ncbi:peptide deformylase [Tissierella praeacuta DSM 18095]|uniref:Peptide deformylase n=1 Tax=Tissierella praeacuta DSM 18095 TaxID=1123404 RepID=A0A1M4SQT6_9FIRM|nr:peptide deformylase [Tissierella praeacuta]SHE34551.1 peptide deformylase [Tissierella praeacuta DSM 18095]SUP01666.1 Peptide deformylase [Tissierella praeacuta]
MALREIRLSDDPILRKKSKEITEITDRIKILLDDMIDTMNEAEGVGLAAPQVGVLRRAVVIDVGEGPIKLINPVITEMKGEEIDIEGCLSVPNRSGTVSRPQWVKVRYLDENGKEKVLEGTGLLARAICHEIDHLEGILYIDKIIEEVEIEEKNLSDEV